MTRTPFIGRITTRSWCPRAADCPRAAAPRLPRRLPSARAGGAGVPAGPGGERVGAVPALVRTQEVRLLEVNAIDFGQRNELLDVDRVAAFLLPRLQLLRRDDQE